MEHVLYRICNAINTSDITYLAEELKINDVLKEILYKNVSEGYSMLNQEQKQLFCNYLNNPGLRITTYDFSQSNVEFKYTNMVIRINFDQLDMMLNVLNLQRNIPKETFELLYKKGTHPDYIQEKYNSYINDYNYFISTRDIEFVKKMLLLFWVI